MKAVRRFGAVEVAEIGCKSVLNRVRGMPFGWSINPYQGCFHQCVFCYARATHQYRELDGVAAWGARITAKVNAPAVLRRELARQGWRNEHVAIGTATDPYQAIEGRYRITRGILVELARAATPAHLITRSPLIVRDLDVLTDLARAADFSVCVSLPTLDVELARRIEPTVAPPAQRLRAVRRLADAGIRVGIAIAPVTKRGYGTRTFVDPATFTVLRRDQIGPIQTITTTYLAYGSFGKATLPTKWTVTNSRTNASTTYEQTEYTIGAVGASDVAMPDSREIVTFPPGVARVTLPTLFDQGKIVVHASVMGHPEDFYLDTGAGSITITPELAKYGVGGQFDTDAWTMRHIELGTIDLQGFTGYRVISKQSYSGNEDGLIGYDLLRHFTVVLDYIHGRLFLTTNHGGADTDSLSE